MKTSAKGKPVLGPNFDEECGAAAGAPIALADVLREAPAVKVVENEDKHNSALYPIPNDPTDGDSDDKNSDDTDAIKVTVSHKRLWGQSYSNPHQSPFPNATHVVHLRPGGNGVKLEFNHTVAITESYYKFIGGNVKPRFLYVWIERNGTLRATMAQVRQWRDM